MGSFSFSRQFVSINRFFVVAICVLASAACSKKEEGGAAVAEKPLTAFEKMEVDALNGTNALRQNPKSIVPSLKYLLTRFREDNVLLIEGVGQVGTVEGAAAVIEAIDAANAAQPSAPLKRSALLDRSARDHQLEQEKTGKIGHYSDDGSSPADRMERYMKFNMCGENISYGVYGGLTGFDSIIQLFVDDGVASRGHRKHLLMPDYQEIGIACGPHPVYESMCVFNYGAGVTALP